jgi:hypothetical protein
MTIYEFITVFNRHSTKLSPHSEKKGFGRLGHENLSGIRESLPASASPQAMQGGEPSLSGGRDLNPRPSAWEADILPLNYRRIKFLL